MTKKHFKAIAEILKNTIENKEVFDDKIEAVRNIAQGLSDYFSEQNPLFDEDRFANAIDITL